MNLNKSIARKRALFMLGTHAFHANEGTYEAYAGLLAGVCGLNITLVDEPFSMTENDFAAFDLLVLAGFRSKANPRTADENADRAHRNILAAVKNGTPLLLLHGGVWTVGMGSLEAEGPKAVGAIHHDPHFPLQEFTVHISKTPNPITTGVDDFKINDEPYRLEMVHSTDMLAWYETSDPRPYTTGKPEKIEENNEKLDQWLKKYPKSPLLYSTRYGSGKIHVNALGHAKDTIMHPSYRALVKNAVTLLTK